MSENEVTALYEKLIAGWNAHDGEAMAAPFAADGVIIGFDGSMSTGKQTIGAEMASIFADHETGRYAVKVQSVRTLGPEAVILRAIAGLVPPGQGAINAETNSHQTVVAESQDGQWRIVLFQNTPAQFHGRPELVEDMTRELQAVADAAT
ncbi:MAG TPA: SgcJ/EcaC family oxidoreductase [Propionibacteriaceae bacterium]|nr:SgcJ/EcaC family oxidoreductase [Propionibacteriaceae bacterium]